GACSGKHRVRCAVPPIDVHVVGAGIRNRIAERAQVERGRISFAGPLATRWRDLNRSNPGRKLEHAAAVGAGRQYMQGGVVLETEDWHGRQVSAERRPGATAESGDVYAVVIADIQGVARVVDGHGPGGKVGQVAADVLPAEAGVRRPEDVIVAEA